jgi:hypothetical protein
LTGLFQLEAPATPGRIPVWAFPLSLAATDGINVFFCSSRYLDVSVPWVRSTHPIHSDGSDGRSSRRVSAFRNPRINACLPASRGLSQATTSFVASRCQDIHRTPLRTWPHLSITAKPFHRFKSWSPSPLHDGLVLYRRAGGTVWLSFRIAPRHCGLRQKRCSSGTPQQFGRAAVSTLNLAIHLSKNKALFEPFGSRGAPAKRG